MRILGAFLGAALMVAGIAARVVSARHVPGRTDVHAYCIGACPTKATGWPQTTYDAVRIGGWALLVFGAVIVAFALIREFRKAA